MTKHIGIVAVSAEGAALCYRTICREGAQIMGRHNHPVVTMHTYPLAAYMEAVESGGDRRLGAMLADSASRLEAAGAEFFICPDNTAHTALEVARVKTGKPWLHIAAEVAAVAEQSGFKALGILGTRLLMDSDVYPAQLEPLGVSWHTPGEAEKTRINDIIFDELVYGQVEPSSKTFFLNVVDSLRQQGCDAVVLGCTEIPLIVMPDESSLPTLDSTRILARAALAYAQG